MKKAVTVPILILFLLVHATGTGDFNVFLQRMIIVGPLENRGDERYDYLEESIREQLSLLIEEAPFIALTDRERGFILALSLDEEYADEFTETDGRIPYRLDPVVLKQDLDPTDHPLYVSAEYRVSEPETETDAESVDEDSTPLLSVSVEVHNTITGETREPVILEGTLNRFIDDPQEFLYPFLPQFLRYTIYRATFTAEPAEALIYVDERLIGIGEARNILVTPGVHRLTVRSDGYRELRDLVQVTADRYTKHVVLQEEPKLIRYLITTTPEEVQVYLDEKYQGKTPVSISVGPGNRVLILRREGYRSESVVVQSLPPAGGTLHFGLIEAGVAEELLEKAERHRRRGRVLSWTGFAVLGSSIAFGILSTSRQQEADLYSSTDPARAADAQNASDLFNSLLIASLVLAGGIFTFSFIETRQYFKIYDQVAEYEQIPLIGTEVSF
jgi:hypothetical protein